MSADGEKNMHTGGDFTERIRQLFDSVPNDSGRRMTVKEVCHAAAAKGHDISEAYLYQLSQGRKSNPSYSAINAISAGFGVPATYFFDDDLRVQIDRQIELLRLLADTPVQQIYFRARDLSDENVEEVLEYVRYLRHKQNLPPLDDLR
ncbi:helix-turn-helix domain-containing protein [Nocardia sp. IBHARD005]|uniref:helix-turn-helix domain-containing protein n=1 Tax=Nocardia sp. IBHARD005 TaxID=3457765 RepID=UPI004058CF82